MKKVLISLFLLTTPLFVQAQTTNGYGVGQVKSGILPNACLQSGDALSKECDAALRVQMLCELSPESESCLNAQAIVAEFKEPEVDCTNMVLLPVPEECKRSVIGDENYTIYHADMNQQTKFLMNQNSCNGDVTQPMCLDIQAVGPINAEKNRLSVLALQSNIDVGGKNTFYDNQELCNKYGFDNVYVQVSEKRSVKLDCFDAENVGHDNAVGNLESYQLGNSRNVRNGNTINGVKYVHEIEEVQDNTDRDSGGDK